MPKNIRTPEEVQEIKDTILSNAIDLIGEKGFSTLSMRKLASSLQMTAANIYNYYRNKDELYLDIQTKGFEKLYESFLEASSSVNGTEEKIIAMMNEYIRFGRENPHWYNIIFSMDTPKYDDYKSSPLQEVAYKEKQAGLKLITFTAAFLKDYYEGPDAQEKINHKILHVWVTLHGLVSLVNSRVLQEVEEDYSIFTEKIISDILKID